MRLLYWEYRQLKKWLFPFESIEEAVKFCVYGLLDPPRDYTGGWPERLEDEAGQVLMDHDSLLLAIKQMQDAEQEG